MQPRIPDLFRSLAKKWAYKAYNWAVPIMLMGPGDQPVLLSGDENGALKTTAGAGSGAPGAMDWGTGEFYTSDSDGDFLPLPSRAAKKLTIYNVSGTDLSVRKAGSGQAPVILTNGFGDTYVLVADCSEIEVRRFDSDPEAAYFTYRYES